MAKREDENDVFIMEKFEFLALTETKMNGNVKNVWREVSFNCSVVQENERGKEGVAILLDDVC